MRLATGLTPVICAAAILTMSFAAVGPTANAYTSAAQSTAAATAPALNCASTYGTDAVKLFGSVRALTNGSKPDKLAAIGMSLIALRYQYEDAPVPPGCESVQPQILKTAAIFEDGVNLLLSAQLDPKNAVSYLTFVTKVWARRLATILPAVLAAGSGSPAAATMVATTTAAAVATMAATSTAGTCPAPYAKQVSDEITALAQPNVSDVASLGQTNLAVITETYKLEDAPPLAGCTVVSSLSLEYLHLRVDAILAGLSVVADQANAKTYTDLVTNQIAPRSQKLLDALNKEIAAGSPGVSSGAAATMVATKAS